MRICAAIVEGAGDEAALPALISRASKELGYTVIIPHPIKVGSWGRLKRPGQLERFVELAMRPDVDSVLISLDLDDGCPKREVQSVEPRRAGLEARFGKPINIVLCRREYETWFLTQIDHLKEVAGGYNWSVGFECTDAEAHRDSKGQVSKAFGQIYKETTDQLRLTRYLDCKRLLLDSRSFRKLMKDALGLDSYEKLNALALCPDF